jgi:predicted  nucleic acid-binding Zn-ribbon protein
MGLPRYDFIGTPRSDHEGRWTDADEAEAEIQRLSRELERRMCAEAHLANQLEDLQKQVRRSEDNIKVAADHIEGQVKFRLEQDQNRIERLFAKDQQIERMGLAHRKSVLSMQGDKDILMARIRELREEIEQLKNHARDSDEDNTRLAKQINELATARNQDRDSGSEVVSQRDMTIDALQAEIKQIMETAQRVNERETGLLRKEIEGLVESRTEESVKWGKRVAELQSQLSVKDQINVELIDERDRLQRVLTETTDGFQALRVKDNDTIAELRQSILLSHTAEERLRGCLDKEVNRKNTLQKESDDCIAELRRSILKLEAVLDDEKYAKERLEEELVGERSIHSVTVTSLSVCLAIAVLFEVVMFFV